MCDVPERNEFLDLYKSYLVGDEAGIFGELTNVYRATDLQYSIVGVTDTTYLASMQY